MAQKRKKNKLLFGVGINDVDYNVYEYENGKQVWICPYYAKWKHILERCFCPKYKEKHPTYKDCTMYEDWIYLSKFIEWVDSQPNRDWENCEPDKDLLSSSHKRYAPDTVVFISNKLNLFLNVHNSSGSNTLIGVSFCEECKSRPWRALCKNPFTGKKDHLGYYSSEREAHEAWKSKKHEHSCKLAEDQTDPRVAEKLRSIFLTESIWTKD